MRGIKLTSISLPSISEAVESYKEQEQKLTMGHKIQAEKNMDHNLHYKLQNQLARCMQEKKY